MDRGRNSRWRAKPSNPSASQSSSGANANNVQGDQQIYNLYANTVDENLSMSYETFNAVIERKIQEKLAEQDQRYMLIISERDDAIEDLAAQRDHYQDVAAHLEARILSLEARWWLFPSWKPLAIAVAASLILGAALTFPLWDVRGASSDTTAARNSPSGASSTQGDETPASGVQLIERQFGTGQYIVQLEEIPVTESLAGMRAVSLRDELGNRLKNAGIDLVVYASTGAEYCIPTKPQLSESVFLWTGPFASRPQAEAACQAMRDKAVSEDCYAASSR